MSNWIWDRLDAFTFSRAAGPAGLLRATMRALRYPYAVIRDLAEGEINMRATGLVFTTLMSLVPLLAFSFAVLHGIGGHAQQDLQPIVLEFFRPMGAQASSVTRSVLQFASRFRTDMVGVIGFAWLSWSLVGTLQRIEDSFNFVWRVPQPRSLGRRIAEYLSLLIVGPLLLGGFIALAHTAFVSGPLQLAASLPLLHRLFSLGVHVAPYLVVTVVFLFLYMFIPNTRVRLGPAAIGAVTAGVGWAAVGSLFTRFVEYSSRLTLVYAGFAAVIAVLIWTYVGWIILLTGTQLSFYIQNPSYLRFGTRRLQLSGAETELLALKLMYLVGRTEHVGRGRLTLDTAAEELGVTGLALAPLIIALEHARILKVRDDELLLGRDPSQVPLHEIVDAARHQHSGGPLARTASVPAITQLVTHLEGAWRECCGRRTLRELLDDGGAAAPASAREDGGRAAPASPRSSDPR